MKTFLYKRIIGPETSYFILVKAKDANEAKTKVHKRYDLDDMMDVSFVREVTSDFEIIKF